MTKTPKIALISAVTAAIDPAQSALREILPDAVIWNILDDRLLLEASQQGGLTDELRRRMKRLIDHALRDNADAVLLTCSLYAPVAESTDADVPVLASDEAAFADIVSGGYGSVLVIASFDEARDDTLQRLEQSLSSAGKNDVKITGLTVPEAMTASKTGDRAALLEALAKASSSSTADAVYLAQYSLAPAGAHLQKTLGIPVISGPKSSAAALRSHISGGTSA
ncbi:hypothetical protein AB4Y87_10560 [Paenarthrobacter sp. RAF54_2]|uniref:hypothetical protein n=1 Tax=Paenarthrobacter sp. RAF54_2 TaxID=3233061 RepID=UPI003F97AC6A